MKERPIIFNTEMVKAILEGRKTQTRRVIKPQPIERQRIVLTITPSVVALMNELGRQIKLIECPYGQVGDRLWVRETFCHKVDPVTAVVSDSDAWYRASNPEVIKVDGDGAAEITKSGYQASPWLPSIHMPRWASRITLETVKVRAERVQEITEEDVVHEGIPCRIFTEGMALFYYHDGGHCTEALPVFAHLWDSLNAKHPWESNPWVWVIEFKQNQNNRR